MGFMPFLVAIAGIAMPVALLYIIFGYSNKSEQRFHDTVQRIIDNGQELNEEVLSSIPGYKKVMPRNDMRNGINTIGVGIGISLLGLVALGDVILGAGLLVTCIGAALVANKKLNAQVKEADEVKETYPSIDNKLEQNQQEQK